MPRTEPALAARHTFPTMPTPDQIASTIHAEHDLLDELRRIYRFSQVEAADYLRFCRENPVGEGR